MMVIDFRIRPPYKSFMSMGIAGAGLPKLDFKKDAVPAWQGRKRVASSMPDGSMEKFMLEMDVAGIEVGVLMGRRTGHPVNGDVDNKDIQELIKKYPGRFVGFGGINPHEKDAVDRVKECADLGFKGIGIDAGWCNPEVYVDDPKLMPVYEQAAKLGLISSITMSAFLGSNINFSDPTRLQKVAQAFPEMPIVVPHGCWPYVTQAFGVALMCNNVHLMPDTYLYVPNFPNRNDWVDAANSGFLRHKLIFCSSYPIRDLSECVENWRSLPFERAPLYDSLYYNAARLLKLTD